MDFDTGDSSYFVAWWTIAVVVAVWVLFLLAYIRIIQKAGYSGWWVLIGLVPILNVVFFLIFAFARWPVTQENDEFRIRLGLPPART